MADIFEEYGKLEEAYAGDAWSLLRSRYSQVYVALLNAVFPDRSKPVRTEALHAAIDTMLEELRAAEYDVPAGSGRELCADRWMNDLRLLEKFELDDGGTEYRLRSTTIAALDAVDRMGSHEVVLSSPRIETIAHEITKMATLVSGDPAARRAQLEADLAAAQEALARFDENGGVVELTPEEVQARLMNVVDLLRQVPGDMRQIEEQLGRERDDLIDEFRADERPHGEVIAEYLDHAEALFNGTDSGQLYNGAVAMFADNRFDADMHQMVRNIASSEYVAGTDVGKKYNIRSSWEAVSDGMVGIFDLRSRCSRTISNAIGSYDMSRYRAMNRMLKRLDSLMWERAMANGTAGKGKSLMTDPLPQVELECLQRKLKGPDTHEPPPALTEYEGEAPAVDLDRLRKLGGPFTAQVVAAFEDLLEPGEALPAATLFACLDEELRRDVEVLGLIRYAASNNLDMSGAEPDVYECFGVDGTERHWLAPRIMVVRGEDAGATGASGAAAGAAAAGAAAASAAGAAAAGAANAPAPSSSPYSNEAIGA